MIIIILEKKKILREVHALKSCHLDVTLKKVNKRFVLIRFKKLGSVYYTFIF